MTDLERAASAAFDATAKHLGRPERWATATQDQRETAMAGTRAAVKEVRGMAFGSDDILSAMLAESSRSENMADYVVCPRILAAVCDSILGEGEGDA